MLLSFCTITKCWIWIKSMFSQYWLLFRCFFFMFMRFKAQFDLITCSLILLVSNIDWRNFNIINFYCKNEVCVACDTNPQHNSQPQKSQHANKLHILNCVIKAKFLCWVCSWVCEVRLRGNTFVVACCVEG